MVEGDILINGRPIGHYMRHISGFMHQEDLFTGSLTVWEHMNIMVKRQIHSSNIYEIYSLFIGSPKA